MGEDCKSYDLADVRGFGGQSGEYCAPKRKYNSISFRSPEIVVDGSGCRVVTGNSIIESFHPRRWKYETLECLPPRLRMPWWVAMGELL